MSTLKKINVYYAGWGEDWTGSHAQYFLRVPSERIPYGRASIVSFSLTEPPPKHLRFRETSP